MKLLPDDPKLTAYALGELDNTERAAIEAALKDSPECRQAVEEIRQMAGMLTKEFADEPCPTLSEKQRETILSGTTLPGAPVSDPARFDHQSPNPKDKIIPFPKRQTVIMTLAAMAACLMAVIALKYPAFQRGKYEVVSAKREGAALSTSSEKVTNLIITSEPLGDLATAAPQPNVNDLKLTLNSPSGSKVLLYENRGVNVKTDGLDSKPNSLNLEPPNTVVSVVDTGVDAPHPDLFPRVVPMPLPPTTDKNGHGTAISGVIVTAGSSVTDPEWIGSLEKPKSTGSGTGESAKKNPSPSSLGGLAGVQSSDTISQKNIFGGTRGRTPAPTPNNPAPGLDAMGLPARPTREALASAQPSLLGRPTAANPDGYVNGIPDPSTGLASVTINPDTRQLIVVTDAQTQESIREVITLDDLSKNQIPALERRVQELSLQFTSDNSVLQAATKKLADLKAVQLRFQTQDVPESTTTAAYPRYYENPFIPVTQQPLSTFSIDVDTASYANVRRFLNAGQLPPPDAVRIEEMVNYFTYNYPQPKGNEPFSASIESASCPWNGEHRLLRVALKGREMAREKRPASNFVFLIDVSGSMQPQERLPLIKQGLRMLVKKMNNGDRVAIVVYASSSGLVLASTSCEQKEVILAAIDRLEAGGSTNGGEGIQRAYDVATENFIKGGVNRVILCTDGDFNVGITDQSQLLNLIQAKAKSGVFLTTLGVGTDNYKDALMQKLADKGNGNYHYLDSVEEAHKVLVEQMNGTLVTIAKDVKIQIEFNPAQVNAYRLIGYEKRMLRAKDFNDDTKDAGEIGAGHTITALYEVVPAGIEIRPAVNDLKYQSAPKTERVVNNGSHEMLTLKLRYKQPDGDVSKLSEFTFTDANLTYRRATTDFKFATAVASFGMILRNSENKGGSNLDAVLELAEESKGADEQGYRAEFINLVKKAKALGK